MTPEERFTRIENAIESLIEIQGHREIQLGELTTQVKELSTSVTGLSTQVTELSTQVEKQNGGIRDLIAVSRILINSQQTTDRQINSLINTVDQLGRIIDRFVQGLQKPNGNE
jgi:phage-related minor tail protein